ncbi:NADH dehydrogenase [ubiquinone] complex I, assembly factor 7 [Trichoderma lentiforme]|uniref:Protein arginine methyltransferase NDUFAF7 n=1 Tax=Trichoderma lentiforme TaxID=1567552 RepID=A0A9P4XKZ5_9HYPO|nr:NADH dehydrogenase [ubiquinone] complex I, assembly factor 7 [Trichoderma lentiforme]
MRPAVAATASLPRAAHFARQRLLLQSRTHSVSYTHITRPSICVPRYFSSTSSRRVEERKWSTPLAKQLYEAISTTGSVPLASYMRMCLTGDLGGYYTGAVGEGRDQFGTKGDFVTSPEISQIFGELLGIWFIAEWMSQGRPSKGVQLIEIGPGRGTLMDDMLRTIQRFPAMANSIENVFMVEASRELRETQKKLLCGPDAPSTESKAGCHSPSKYGSAPIVWTETIKSIPIEPDKTPFIVAHEFFDALPIHTFQSAAAAAPKPSPSTSSSPQPDDASPAPDPAPPTMEWREMMVSITPPGATHADLGTPKSQQHEPPPEFQLVLSSSTTRHSRVLPESSTRYRRLKQHPGSVIEICPDASLYAADFAARIGGSRAHPKASPSGAALILDYGTADTVPINSLRGIRQHRLVSPFSAPGLVDLSADVDFHAIAEAATLASDGVEVHGPISQADFLELMGIRQRAEALSKVPGVSPSKASDIEKAWKRLVDRGPSGMGKVYKALAILPENDGRRRPVGFGGDVTEA